MKKKIFFYENMVAMNERSNNKMYALRGENGQDGGRKRQLNKVIKDSQGLVS